VARTREKIMDRLRTYYYGFIVVACNLMSFLDMLTSIGPTHSMSK